MAFAKTGHLCLGASRNGGPGARSPKWYNLSIEPIGMNMSADRDRGIRRQKQKRAKQQKKQARQPKPAGIERSAAAHPSKQQGV